MTAVQADTLHAFVSRSSCALKFLAIRLSGICNAAQIQHLFRASKTIEHLDLTVSSSWAPLLQALRSVNVLPRLRRLEVHGRRAMEGDRARLLLDLVTGRRTHGVLESFELVVILNKPRDVPASAIIAEFRTLGEAGLEVRIATRRWGDSTPSVVLLDS
jgi:hypothetical protein